MLEFKRKELEHLERTLDWVLVSTISTKEGREQLLNIKNKLRNLLKSAVRAEAFSIKVVDDEKTDSF